jgi:hypothetical protein
MHNDVGWMNVPLLFGHQFRPKIEAPVTVSNFIPNNHRRAALERSAGHQIDDCFARSQSISTVARYRQCFIPPKLM